MRRLGIVLLAVIAIAPAGIGCGGKYTVRLEVEDVINASEGKPSGDQLPVDIVVMTSEETGKYPQVTDGRLRSDEWFKFRMNNDPQLPSLPPAQIYSLRPDIERLRGRDNRVGDALVGARYRSDGARVTEVKVEHPQPGNGDACIAIYGWFKERSGDSRTAPLIIRPPGAFGPKVLEVRVGRDRIECSNCD